jgi:lipopolysaccharide export system permease protein
VRGILTPLDRYVAREFWKIFIATALGFPLLVIVIDLADNLDKYLNRNLSSEAITMAYVYWVPDSMFMALPAAVLFATVFTIGAFTRHAEITAAKASGISFHRLVAPIFVSAIFVTMMAGMLSELVPVTNRRRAELLEERRFQAADARYNFPYAAEHGRVYKIAALNVQRGVLDAIEIERKGMGPDYPTYILTASSAEWRDTAEHWTLMDGEMHILPDSVTDFVFEYDSMLDNVLREAPQELVARAREPNEMRYRELGLYIRALERSGGDVNELKVEQALKIAVPVTCFIIAIFGAPLATSTKRGGAAFGIGISLATTILFLTLIQITKAVGGGGLLPPAIAAWTPNVLFALAGLILLARART